MTPAKSSTDIEKRVLFFSPITPSFSGNGLAMRAASLLEALHSLGFQIRLVVVPILEGSGVSENPEIRSLCESYFRLSRPENPLVRRLIDHAMTLGRRVGFPFKDRTDSVWERALAEHLKSSGEGTLLFVFRLSTLSLFSVQSIGAMPLWLDLDEVDSAAADRAAILALAEQDHEEHRQIRRRALGLAKLENKLLKLARWASVSSETERKRLPSCAQEGAIVLPNVVRLQTALPSRGSGEERCRLLYVGNFRHPPNVDAVSFFCREILTLLQARSERPIEFIVVGPDPLGKLAAFKAMKDVAILGWVENLIPIYEKAEVVVVPLRSGAGTRIKILEAFSFGRCVVSTSIGAEGLEVTSGQELVLADTAPAFADASAALISDPAQREIVAAKGHDFVRRKHSLSVVHQALQRGLAGGSPS